MTTKQLRPDRQVRTVRHAPKPRGIAPAYRQLRAFFPVAAGLARALGVREATVASWERGVSRTWASSLARISMLSGLCEELRPFMPTEASVGRWLLAPHPFFNGQSPAQALRANPDVAYDQIIDLTGRAAEIKAARSAFLDDLAGSERNSEFLAAAYGTARSK